jgi:hypothetical protein
MTFTFAKENSQRSHSGPLPRVDLGLARSTFIPLICLLGVISSTLLSCGGLSFVPRSTVEVRHHQGRHLLCGVSDAQIKNDLSIALQKAELVARFRLVEFMTLQYTLHAESDPLPSTSKNELPHEGLSPPDQPAEPSTSPTHSAQPAEPSTSPTQPTEPTSPAPAPAPAPQTLTMTSTGTLEGVISLPPKKIYGHVRSIQCLPLEHLKTKEPWRSNTQLIETLKQSVGRSLEAPQSE